ncbi:MAG: 4Fe-4S binding protein [Alphaproteobacteria bacterium]|nr:4Fe-4S binding protein [Alphaproteobacteria bacterium]
MSYKIDPNKCVSCGACAGACPMAAIALAAGLSPEAPVARSLGEVLLAKGGKYEIKKDLCANCGMCVALCPMAAIAKDEKKEQ